MAWRRFGEAPADLRPWLFGVARHVLRHDYRATQRRDALSARLASALARLGHEPGADAGWLAEALPQLSESDRDVLTLTASEGFQTPRQHRCSGELAALLGDLESAGAVDRIIGSAAEPCGRGAGAAKWHSRRVPFDRRRVSTPRLADSPDPSIERSQRVRDASDAKWHARRVPFGRTYLPPTPADVHRAAYGVSKVRLAGIETRAAKWHSPRVPLGRRRLVHLAGGAPRGPLPRWFADLRRRLSRTLDRRPLAAAIIPAVGNGNACCAYIEIPRRGGAVRPVDSGCPAGVAFVHGEAAIPPVGWRPAHLAHPLSSLRRRSGRTSRARSPAASRAAGTAGATRPRHRRDRPCA
ncbi:MAG: hypothetical protein QOD65_2025 [Gaiellales bacterium]|nr:hypothetical protein [Gaiellales bacterium]